MMARDSSLSLNKNGLLLELTEKGNNKNNIYYKEGWELEREENVDEMMKYEWMKYEA